MLAHVRALLTSCLLVACAVRPEHQPIVSSVDIVGNEELDEDVVLEALATQPTPRFLGLFQGLFYDYRVFSEAVLVRDLARVGRRYQAEGFHAVRVRAGRIHREADEVHVQIVVEEGPRTLIGAVTTRAEPRLEGAETDALLDSLSSHAMEGEPLRESDLALLDAEARAALQNLGYPDARVQSRAFVDLPNHSARVDVEIEKGRRAVLGEIEIRGLGPIPEGPVRRALDLTPGELYSEEALDDAEKAVLDLGVFSSVSIQKLEPAAQGATDVVPLVVKLQPTSLRTLRLGGGFELDALRTDVHASAGWSDRNFFGDLRSFSVSVRPGVVLYPTRLPSLEPPERLLPEVTTDLMSERPGFLEPRTRGFVNLGYDVYPVLLNPGSESDLIIGYREFRGTAGVSRSFGDLKLTPRYGLQAGVPFAYRGELSQGTAPVYISYVEWLAVLDGRDDKLAPHEGYMLEVAAQFAGLGGDARDVKVEPGASGYVPVSSRVTWASHLQFGALFPFNYETFADGNSPSIRDTQVGYFRALFSGGPTSNRGYAYRGVGPHGAVSFFDPTIARESQADYCDRDSMNYDSSRCAFPLGGLSSWQASTGLRIAVSGPFLLALFCDASDVSLESLEYEFRRPHLSCGLGPRYNTPVGPVRLDLAYRIPGLQVMDGSNRNEGHPGSLLGLPMGISFGIGEVY